MGFLSLTKEFRNELSVILKKPYEDIKVRIHGLNYYKDITLSIEAKTNYKKVYGSDTA